jgi:septum formation protein
MLPGLKHAVIGGESQALSIVQLSTMTVRCVLSPLDDWCMAVAATPGGAEQHARLRRRPGQTGEHGLHHRVERQPAGPAGHMTDGRGVLEALRSHIDPAGVNVLIVGAGAAARATALELSLARAGEILVCDRTPERATALVEALAAFKAARVTRMLGDEGERDAVVVAADTLCFDGSRPVGKPRDEAEAGAFLRAWRGRPHRTVTGVCVLADGRRTLFSDLATVEVGDLDDGEIDRYVAGGGWRGKAGGYNLAERLAAGWPIRCEGDPTSVMGLPMQRVVPLLRSLGCGPDGGAR